jgi:hypothetical protein
MQTRLGLASTGAKVGAGCRRLRAITVLLLGLAVSACAGTGQLANFTETARPSIAFEAIDGTPSIVVPRFVTILKEAAAQKNITVGAREEVNYRLRGYLGARDDDGKTANTTASVRSVRNSSVTTSIAWILDVYDSSEQRVIHLSGEEKVSDRLGAATDDQTLRRVANAGMDQLAAFLATSRAPAGAAVAAPHQTAFGSGWLDDWTPEASGIFRIFGRETSSPAAVAEAKAQPAADDVPLPRGRPTPAAAPSATGDRAENDR